MVIAWVFKLPIIVVYNYLQNLTFLYLNLPLVHIAYYAATFDYYRSLIAKDLGGTLGEIGGVDE